MAGTLHRGMETASEIAILLNENIVRTLSTEALVAIGRSHPELKALLPEMTRSVVIKVHPDEPVTVTIEALATRELLAILSPDVFDAIERRAVDAAMKESVRRELAEKQAEMARQKGPPRWRFPSFLFNRK